MRSRKADGYLLLETTIALAIIGLALVLTVSTVWRYRLATERLAAHREGIRVLELAHETLRARAAPLRPGRLNLELRGSARFRPQVFVEIQHMPRPGLEKVTLVCRYALQGSIHQRSLETLFWQP